TPLVAHREEEPSARDGVDAREPVGAGDDERVRVAGEGHRSRARGDAYVPDEPAGAGPPDSNVVAPGRRDEVAHPAEGDSRQRCTVAKKAEQPPAGGLPESDGTVQACGRHDGARSVEERVRHRPAMVE